MTKFTCLQCGRLFRISDIYAGKRIPCLLGGVLNDVPESFEIKDFDDSMVVYR
jgi:hypothetical protein